MSTQTDCKRKIIFRKRRPKPSVDSPDEGYCDHCDVPLVNHDADNSHVNSAEHKKNYLAFLEAERQEALDTEDYYKSESTNSSPNNTPELP